MPLAPPQPLDSCFRRNDGGGALTRGWIVAYGILVLHRRRGMSIPRPVLHQA